MVSGLFMFVGFKNGIDGSLDIVINVFKLVVLGYCFMGINK